VRLSKSLSYVLRHGAKECGLNMRSDGFVRLQQIMALKNLKQYTVDDVRRVVAENNKKRFALVEEPFTDGEPVSLLIRANQGHTLQVPELELQAVTSPADLPVALHGTYFRAWESIRQGGLSRMQRNHIHLAEGEYGAVTSGVRQNCELHIYIDTARAMQEGVQFFRSANGVILTEGIGGVIPTHLFARVIRTSDGASVPLC